MKKLLTIAAAAVLGLQLTVSGASAQTPQAPEKERDYLVQIGKRPVFASELRRQEAEARKRANRPVVHSKGRFVEVGKQVVWVEGDRPAPMDATSRRYLARESRPYIPSNGRFVQQGKAQVWVPNDRESSERVITEKVGSQ